MTDNRAPPAMLYDYWFDQIAKNGKLIGRDAVTFFGKSSLSREVLSKVWAISDTMRTGTLERKQFHRAMELLSLSQAGHDVTNRDLVEEMLAGSVEPPEMEGLHYDMEAIQKFRSKAVAPAPAKTVQEQVTKKGWFGRTQKKAVSQAFCNSIIDGLKQIYFTKVRPLEEQFRFGDFFSPCLNEGDFDAKPSVLLLGQYSTGKTTFIKHILGQEYPGCHIGPEPTTDRFVVVEHGFEDRVIPGNTLTSLSTKAYQGLQVFGSTFLGRFQSSETKARLLEEISLVDTPGILSGEKQLEGSRGYDFIRVCGWFASRCDLILLLFDPYKLDISDEYKYVMSTLRGHDDKVRVVLNKADSVDQQQLMRVYGALMWSLGKVFNTPEVVRVYVGSFNSPGVPIREDMNPHAAPLFEAEHKDLLDDLYDIPRRGCDRKINEFVKRVRAFKIHMLVIGHLRKQLGMFGKEKTKKKLLDSLPQQFQAVQQEYRLPAGDFPNVDRYRQLLSSWDFAQFPKLDKKMIKTVEDVLNQDVTSLSQRFRNPFPENG